MYDSSIRFSMPVYPGDSENVIDALALMLSPEPGDVDDQREREALRLTIAA
jgi:hypothetical protein